MSELWTSHHRQGAYCCGGNHGGSRGSIKLLTLRQSEWVEKYLQMNTAYTDAAVLSSSDSEYLIVIGGEGGGG